MMNYSLITICFISFCCQALATLPAPVNLTVESVNFEYSLRWDPGPGMPPGTNYRVRIRCHGRKPKTLRVANSSIAAVKETLQDYIQDVLETYNISVRAVNHGERSNWTNQTFTPFVDTRLGPPEVTVLGCGDCLNLTITLPRGKANESISEIYHIFDYHISWKNAADGRVWNVSTTENNIVQRNLQTGSRYCVRVGFHLNTNKNTLPSDWVCALTSPVKSSPVIPILASISTLLILGGLVFLGLNCSMTDLLMLKVPHPKKIFVKSNSYQCYIAEAITPDAVTCEPKGKEKSGGAVAQQPTAGACEEEEEEEEDSGGDNGYENRAGGVLEGSSSSAASHNATDSSSSAVATTLSTVETSGSSVMASEEPEWAGTPTGDGTQVLALEPRKELDTADGDTVLGENVNLLSVMLGGPEGVAELTGALWEPTGSGEWPVGLGGASSERRTDGGVENADSAPLLTLPACAQTDAHSLLLHANWDAHDLHLHANWSQEGENEDVDEEEEEGDAECSGYMRR
ncbi:hypothetical protein GJAV_G00254660 [Gymnothorax javanicus]|nr:hypothetical protein GJAV_G00254660 [Gymnothorax javanicus]